MSRMHKHTHTKTLLEDLEVSSHPACIWLYFDGNNLIGRLYVV